MAPGRSLRLLVLAASAVALLGAASGAAAGRAAAEKAPTLGPPPADLPQTWLASLRVSGHVFRPGETVTVIVKVLADTCFVPDPPCVRGAEWSLGEGAGKVLSGCSAKVPLGRPTLYCRFKAVPADGWQIVGANFPNPTGTPAISQDFYVVVGGKKFWLGGHVTDEAGRPLPNVTVRYSGPESGTRKTDAGGAYGAVIEKGRYVVWVERDGMRPVETKDCVATKTTCKVNLIQDRTADFEAATKILQMKAKLGAKVRSPERPSLIKAGTKFLIHVTLRNTSRTKRLLVYPIYATLSGNAADGHLTDRPLGSRNADGSIDELEPSPYLVFKPKQVREFDIVVRTSSSDPTVEDGPQGGTRATVDLSAPRLAEIGKGKALTQLDPAKAVELADGSEHFTVGIDDSAAEPPPFSPWEATYYITKGLLVGVWNATWGIARGVLWDLPKLAIGALAATPSAALNFVNYQAELWGAIKDDPAAVALFLNPLTNLALVAAREAPWAADKASDLLAQVNASVKARYDKMWNDWYAGDWRTALTDMSAEGTEQLANVALALAPGLLARSPAVLARWKAAKAALYTRVDEGLAPVLAGAGRAAESLIALAGVIKPGFPLNRLALSKLYGITAEQTAWLQQFAKSNRLLITLRSRAQQAQKWLQAGAALKPAWIKIKTVGRLDVKYLRYRADDVGRLVLREPPSKTVWEEQILPRIPARERDAATALWERRVKEWNSTDPGYGDAMRQWSQKQEVTGKWPWSENLVDPAAQADEFTTIGFRLKPTGRAGEFVVEVQPQKGGPWASVTGDVDFLSITKADGKPLTDAEHVSVLKQLREGPVGAEHPESATWVGDSAAREQYLANNGECCPAQFTPLGKVFAVQYNPKLSWFKDPGRYRVWWEGGYFVPAPAVR